MNDNQEKNKSIDETAPEPVTKKIAKFSAFIYLGLAITVVIVATVGIFSISYDYEESIPPVSFPEIGTTDDDYSVPQIVITPEDIQKPEASTPEAPVVNEESGVDSTVSEDEPTIMFYRPVAGEVCKNYSMDALVFSATMGDYRVHSGIDIAAQIGEAVVCFADGIVESINNDYFYGMTVSVAHDDGTVSYYMNLSPDLAENIVVGNQVKAGQQLGTVGETARCENADEPHLHFELRINDTLVDPTNEIPK